MIVRGTEFPEEMLKLFIERICDEIGGASTAVYDITNFAYDGEDVFDLLGKNRCKRLKEEIDSWKKRVDAVSNDSKFYNKKYMEERQLAIDNMKKVRNLESENDKYSNTVIEYERLLSRLRLEEFKR